MDYLKQLDYPEKITSVEGFLKVIRGTRQQDQEFFLGNFVCYRGQTQDWPLMPSAFRDEHSNDQGICFEQLPAIAENELYREFHNRIRGYNTHIDLDNPWELICFAQHFGVPTRLIDWATNPLAALYFALETDQNQEYAVVWCLKVTKLNPNPQKNAHQSSYKERDYWRGYFLSDLPPKPAFFDRLPNRNQRLPHQFTSGLVLIQPPDIDNRIKNQGSLFTVHIPEDKELVVDHGKFIVSNHMAPETILLKLKIPMLHRRDILDELWDLGVTPYSLYPDLEGLGKYLKIVNRNRRDDSRPY